ncbi:MAG: ribonuclease H-like domain-containing protein, partial [Fimbriimonas ginsengisoli]|nr:ribonuclease H-like domain-containing protein [Fimbriimonas ginsengisoli]
ISLYSVIVTFAGWMFDLPVLERAFGGLRFDQIHVDLCPTLRQVGLRGGLKRIERELGVARDGEVDGLTGLDAVRLWRRYKRFDDEAALQRLIAYNRADVVNLERLSQIAYDRLRRQTMLPVQPTLW